MKDISYVDMIKLIAFIIFLIMPPWFAMLGQLKKRIPAFLTVLMTLGYTFICTFGLLLSQFTQTIIPFILVLITIHLAKKNNDNNEINYYLRSLSGRKKKVIWHSILFKIATLIITMYFVYELQKLGFAVKEQEISNQFMNEDIISVILLSILAVVIAPVLEEFVFRHILYRGFAMKIGRVLSAILTSIMFTVLHFNLASSAAIFSVGLFNCYLYEREGYRAAVLSHFIFNLTSVVMALLVRFSGFNLT